MSAPPASGTSPVSDPVPKTYRFGTHRTVAPADTLARLRPLLGRMGITRIANLTGLDRTGIPVVMACRPNSRSLAVSQGKGPDLAAAKASAVMEAVETFHAEAITSPLKLGSHRELTRSHPLVDVRALPAAAGSPYDEDQPLLWIEGRDLFSGAPFWVPYEVVHTDYTLSFGPASGYFPANTNGLASGNHLLEAVSHGIYEVVERDATTLWKRGSEDRKRAGVLDLDTVDDAACRAVLARFERADVAVKVWDTTSDVGIASFYCLVVGRGDDAADPEFGGGCHPTRGVALLRALTEAAQARTTYIAGSRDDLGPEEYTAATRGRRLRTCRTLMDTHAPARDFHDVPTWEADGFAEDVSRSLDRLAATGVQQVLVVDLTNPDLGVPVVRVVIPGLEGPDKGERSDYVPGLRARAVGANRA